MNEELKAIDWLRAKTISYESRSEELHYALVLYNLIMNLQQENEELKKQLSNSHQIKNQQKEFIEWLEDKLNMCDGFLDTIKSDLEEISYTGRASGKTYIATQIMKNETAKKCYEEVLSKYKEIIGSDNK